MTIEKDKANLKTVEVPIRSRAFTYVQPSNVSQQWYTSRAESKHGHAASQNFIPASEDSRESGSTSSSFERLLIEELREGRVKENNLSRRSLDSLARRGRSPKFCVSQNVNLHEPTLNKHEGIGHSRRSYDSNLGLPVQSQLDNVSSVDGSNVNSICNTRDEPEDNVFDQDSGNAPEDLPPRSDDDQIQDSGASFEDLVDRLLAQPKSKSDTKFITIFLCLYRKFAAPSTLVVAIIRRFEDLNDQDLPSLVRMTSQLRYLNILKEWVSDYPGDFAHPISRRIISGFVQGLTTSQEYMATGKEISPHLEVVSEDDDTEWACSDNTRSRASTMESSLTMSSVRSAVSALNVNSPTLTADSSTEDVDHLSREKEVTSNPSRISATPSSTSSISRSDSQSANSFQTPLNTVENAQRQAQLLTPMSKYMLTKLQWHQFMEIPEDQIARELTRIDWIMYSSIRPRDLIRHVSLQADQKEKCKSLEHVNRMIHQFNHVAFWVSNVILLRDKSKHRAKALAKFMLVAWKLRHLNNYNSLGAVIAGINGTAVHRLSQTRELIPPEAQKQFMRLEILMGTQKSHFAYRLAFENTSTSRIPFLPLHRRDLVLAEQANRTYLNSGGLERINWKKFEIMGEVIVSIRKSQDVGYPTIGQNEEVQRLILEGRFCKDDDVSFSNVNIPCLEFSSCINWQVLTYAISQDTNLFRYIDVCINAVL